MDKIRLHIARLILLSLILLGTTEYAHAMNSRSSSCYPSEDFVEQFHLGSPIHEKTVSQPRYFVESWVNSLLFNTPMESEEKEENEEEEVDEDKSHLVKLSVKDFYYTDLMCCSALRFQSEYDTNTDQLILDDCFYVIRNENSQILFQVFRL